MHLGAIRTTRRAAHTRAANHSGGESMSFLRPAAAVAAFATFGAFAGQYDQPYAIVEVGDASKVREEFVPAISQIDGKSTRNTRRSAPIAPGAHVITGRFETGRVAQGSSEVSQKVEMNLEGCMRY